MYKENLIPGICFNKLSWTQTDPSNQELFKYADKTAYYKIYLWLLELAQLETFKI